MRPRFRGHFGGIAGPYPHVVQIRARDIMPETMGERVVGLLAELEHELDLGAIVSIDLELARVRILPLGDPGSSP